MARLVVFDVDSTLLAVETLDYALARAARAPSASGSHGPAENADLARRLEAVTSAGMEGTLGFAESLARRLALAPLTRTGLAEAAAEIAARPTPGMAELLADLRARADQVRAVSGGFGPLILPALARLGFEEAHVHANAFRYEGERVVGLDPDSPLTKSGGKAVVVRALRGRLGPEETIVVGDGVTDLEAWEEGAADRFIGFGGVARRAAVEVRAPAYALDVSEVRALLLGG